MIYLIVGVSGSGKTTIQNKLLDGLLLNNFISDTSRAIREGETERDYHFVSKQEFVDGIHNDMYAEYALVFGNYYGIKYQTINDAIRYNSNDTLHVVDYQGAKTLTDKYSQYMKTIYILPPSFKELHNRLVERGDTNIEDRMSTLEEELMYMTNADLIVVNNDLDEAVLNIGEFIMENRGSNDTHT